MLSRQDSEEGTTNEWKILAKEMVKHLKTPEREYFKDKISHLESTGGFSNRRIKKEKKVQDPVLPMLKTLLSEEDMPVGDFNYDIPSRQPQDIFNHLGELSKVISHYSRYSLFTAVHIGKYLFLLRKNSQFWADNKSKISWSEVNIRFFIKLADFMDRYPRFAFCGITYDKFRKIFARIRNELSAATSEEKQFWKS